MCFSCLSLTRHLAIVENGIKPAYVFDGKPPVLKTGIVYLNLFSLTPCGDKRHNGRDLKDAKKRNRMGKMLRRQVGGQFVLCPEAHCILAIGTAEDVDRDGQPK